MAVCSLRTLLLIVCIIELIVTIQRQVFDFLGYMWLPIIANFLNIILIIFGSFGAVQYITKYLLAYAIWSFIWLKWNIFLICYYLNLGTLNRESGLLSLGTGSVSWWEGNGWGCQPVWGEGDAAAAWRPERVDGCFLPWHHVELAQSALASVFTIMALPLAILLSHRSLKKRKTTSTDKSTLPRNTMYTIELSRTETSINESSLKPMTPRRVKRRSGSRGHGAALRRSRRSYRNAAYLSSSASLPPPRDPRPASAHSSYSNFHAARPASLHAREPDPPPPPADCVPILTNRHAARARPAALGYDVAGPYSEPAAASYDGAGGGYVYGAEGAWAEPPPPAPPYSARATPQAPGPPAYHQLADTYDAYNMSQ